MSLRYRIALTVFVLEVVMILMALSVTIGYSTDAAKKMAERSDQRLLGMVAVPARNALLTEEYGAVQHFAEKAIVDPHVGAIVLLGANDRLLISTDPAMNAMTGAQIAAHPDEYWLWHSIDGVSGHLGKVGIRFSNALLTREIAHARNTGLMVALSGMLIIAIAGLAIGFLLTRRLERLTLAAGQLAAGDTNVRVGMQGRDEIARLGQSFDSMAERVSHAMQDLRNSERRNRLLVEGGPAAIFVFDVDDFCLSDVNQKMVELLKYPREQLIGMTPSGMSPPLQKDGRPTNDVARELMQSTFADERPVAHWILRTATGEDVPCEMQLSVYPDTDRKQIIGVIYDVTERARINKALDRRLEFEDLIVRLSVRLVGLKPEQIDGGLQGLLAEIGQFAGVDRSYVFEFSPDHKTESCTHEWCAAGVEPEIQRLQDLPLGNYPWFMERIGKGVVLHVPRVSELPPGAAAERAEFEVENIQSVIMVPLVFEGQVSGYMGFDAVRRVVEWPPEIVVMLKIAGEIAFNALHRKRSENALREQAQALEKANTALARSNEELKQFAYVASHDLREPLRAIAGFSALLQQKYHGRLDQDADDYIQFMTDAATRMHAMINDLLSYSRVDTQAEPFRSCDMQQMLKLAQSNLLTTISEQQALITHGILPVVKADTTQVIQLLQNLIGNAIKFHGSERPTIHVDAERRGDEWLFSVTDNGIGIDKRHAETVFEIFKRLHVSEKYPGTGIGLAVCKRIVERHGGRIWVEGNEGQGSTFCFTLPAIV